MRNLPRALEKGLLSIDAWESACACEIKIDFGRAVYTHTHTPRMIGMIVKGGLGTICYSTYMVCYYIKKPLFREKLCKRHIKLASF